MSTKELLEQRGKLIADARALNDKVKAEDRAMTPEEETQFDKLMDEAESIKDKVDAEDRSAARKNRLEGAEGDLKKVRDKRSPTPAPGTEPGQKPSDDAEARRVWGNRATPEYAGAFRSYVSGGQAVLNADETRALQADNLTVGGYLLAPQQFVGELLKAVDDAVFIRQKARKFSVVSAESLGVPSLDTDISDADWTSELLTGSEDSSIKFGKRELRPHPFAKLVKISNKLLRASTLNPEAFVRERLAYKFGVTEEKAFLTGTGSQQPLGIFTASTDGISTSRDVSTGNTTTSIQADGLIEAQHTLKGQYWGRATWGFHRDAIKQIRKLKDGNGQYLWQPGLRGGVPNEILGMPYFVSEFAPNTFTTGLYVGILGDFSFYWIADALSVQVQRLVERYAETNQTGFIGRAETDGMPVLEEAFVRVKLA